MAVAAGCKKPAGGRGHVEKHVETPRGERTREENTYGGGGPGILRNEPLRGGERTKGAIE